jgi:hypothetical protein
MAFHLHDCESLHRCFAPVPWCAPVAVLDLYNSLVTLQGTMRHRGEEYDISWDSPSDVYTTVSVILHACFLLLTYHQFSCNMQHNEAGRGCELSELVLFQGKMMTFDDRTGIMFEILNYDDSSGTGELEPFVVPRQLFMEGDGLTDKGMKVEWATVKDNLLYVGSFGKEYTNNDGSIAHSNNLWTKVLTKDGIIQHVNWKENYDRLRETLGFEHPS